MKFWRNVRVGELILVLKDSRIPADLLVLSSSEEDGSTFMETSTLDGEKNLKPRFSLKETYQNATIENLKKKKKNKNEVKYEGDFDLNFCLKINVQHPNPSLYKFQGHIFQSDKASQKGKIMQNNENKIFNEEKKISIGVKNFLFKGAMIRNVDWTLGVVLYTGKDSKIQQNGAEARYKVSTLEQKLHKMIIYLFGFQVILGIVAVAVKRGYKKNLGGFDFDQYLEENGSTGNDTAFYVFIRYFLLLNSLIPISLIVNLEMVRLVQAYFIGKNIELKNIRRNM